MEQAFGEYRRRRDFLLDSINSIPGVFLLFPWAHSTGGASSGGDAEVCKWCLTDSATKGATVFMAPAAGFYTTPDTGRNKVRIAYVLKQEDLELAVEVLAAALDAYRGYVAEMKNWHTEFYPATGMTGMLSISPNATRLWHAETSLT